MRSISKRSLTAPLVTGSRSSGILCKVHKYNQTRLKPTERMNISSRKSSLIALLVAGAFFMENLDGTVIATALPQMGRSFHVSPVDLNMGMTAYMLMLAVFIPISGWIADRFGPRTVFVAAIAVFTVSSILCGLSQGLWEFTLARIVQGIGGAMMVPVGRLVVLRTTEKARFDAPPLPISRGPVWSLRCRVLPSVDSSRPMRPGIGFSF